MKGPDAAVRPSVHGASKGLLHLIFLSGCLHTANLATNAVTGQQHYVYDAHFHVMACNQPALFGLGCCF
jgi:hypothetical protein